MDFVKLGKEGKLQSAIYHRFLHSILHQSLMAKDVELAALIASLGEHSAYLQVLNGNPYNRKYDVYCFGISLWEMYDCDLMYPDLSFSEATSQSYDRCCPSSLAIVMERCWDANPDKMPEMYEVVAMLEAIDTSKGCQIIAPDFFSKLVESIWCLAIKKFKELSLCY